ncbi:DUF294 nucleotidyltransferase-like domain-containing protein [Ferrimonas senticii]|uniref:DUF294 nucleotidyltransferase-like domain-containing protein n=1 Tax=Ferrimonas senticii TaxID=394566 RepID=UPI0004177BEB|nr:DUF294 nucleotidyltransferase-like domain-containing protein [Ferrimonas senticii]
MTLKSNSPVLAFYQQCLPFSLLTEAQQQFAESHSHIAYFAKADNTVAVNYSQPQLYLVRSGAFELRSDQGQLIDRLGEGDYFGFPSLLTGDKVSNQVRIIEDGLVYVLSETGFNQLCSESREFQRFFNRQQATRLRHQQRFSSRDHSSTIKLKTVMSTPVQRIASSATVQQAAQQMAQAGISALLIEEADNCGIITDRDLRNRVLAQGLSLDTPVAQVMTSKPVCADAGVMVFEAQLLMAQADIHHLPVREQDKLVGIVTSSDLLRLERTELPNLASLLAQAEDVAALVQLSLQFMPLLQQMIAADARAEEVGRVLTLLADAVTQRLTQLAIKQLGEPPMAWCWLCFGSQARMDMAGQSDQDNGLLLERDPNEAEASYFAEFAQIVCDGLNACGYIYCPGNIMASNPKLRVPVELWQRKFNYWLEQPDPNATLNASVFFDLRPLAGRRELGQQLHQWLIEQPKSPLFLAHLTGHALQNSPPLGFFRQWLLEENGQQQKSLDLKRRGLLLINDIARLHALSCGSEEVNTLKRLQAAMAAGALTRNDALNLADAHEFIGHLRLSNQGKQWQAGEPLSNNLVPDSLSELSRHQLKLAFRVAQRGQDGIGLRYRRQL